MRIFLNEDRDQSVTRPEQVLCPLCPGEAESDHAGHTVRSLAIARFEDVDQKLAIASYEDVDHNHLPLLGLKMLIRNSDSECHSKV